MKVSGLLSRAAGSLLARLALAVVATPCLVAAQDVEQEDRPAATRPGLLRVGPFYFTPRLRVGTIGIDTNVFYTATDRRTDFIASGGPGLRAVLPIRQSWHVAAEGGVEYLYFLRTTSQRRWTGDGRARSDWSGLQTRLLAEVARQRTFSRPSMEVDRRVVQDQRQARLAVERNLGPRLRARGEASATRTEIEAGQSFFGADLDTTLSRDTYVGLLELAFRITPKTSFVLEGDHQIDRFLFEPARDADSNRFGGGFDIVSRTLLSGRAVGGVRSFRLVAAGGARVLKPYAVVDLTYHFGPRTRIGAAYGRDLQYSAFTPEGPTPTITVETYRGRLEKGLFGRFDLRLMAGLTRLLSDGPVTIRRNPDDAIVTVRDDTAREAGADLGYTFRSRLRIGVAATYLERRSTIADFGIKGLLVGATVTYSP